MSERAKPWNPNGEIVYEVQMGPTNPEEHVYIVAYVIATSVAEATSIANHNWNQGPVVRVVRLGEAWRHACTECN